MSIRVLAFLGALALAPWAFAQNGSCLPAKPANEDHLVFQYTSFLDDREQELLDAKLVNFARETSNRIAVVIVDTLCGYPEGEFAQMIGQAWGLGKKGFDNGVVLLVKPTGPPGQRKVYIATGYGLEGAIPDLTCKRIVDNEIIPRFKQSEFYDGLDAGTNVLMQLAKGEINAKSYGKAPFDPSPFLGIGAMILFVIFFMLVQRGRARRYARLNHVDFWTAWTLLNAASRSHGGSWGGFSGGGGSSGGGGGFGGFGGGSFGGGGSGGSW